MGELALAGGRTRAQLRHRHHREPNALCAKLHNRMPVVLKPEAWPEWLDEEPADETRLKFLLATYPSDRMVCWPVSVGNVRNNDPSLIEPMAEMAH